MATAIVTAALPSSDQPNVQPSCCAPAQPKALSGAEVSICGGDAVSGALTEHACRDRVVVGLQFAGVGFLSWMRADGETCQRELIGQQTYIVPPGTVHATRQEARSERLYVYIEPALWKDTAKHGVPQVMIVERALHDSTTWRIAYLCRERFLAREESAPKFVDLVGGLLACRLGQLLSGAPVSLGRRLTEEQWQRVIDYAKSDPKVRVTDMARRVCLSTQHFTELCTNTAGESPYQLGIKLRLLRAHALLLEGKLPWKAIAEAVGYSDVHDFSKVFREFWGYSVQEVLASVPTASAIHPQ